MQVLNVTLYFCDLFWTVGNVKAMDFPLLTFSLQWVCK